MSSCLIAVLPLIVRCCRCCIIAYGAVVCIWCERRRVPNVIVMWLTVLCAYGVNDVVCPAVLSCVLRCCRVSCSAEDGEEAGQEAGGEQALLGKVTAGPAEIPENLTATETLQTGQETTEHRHRSSGRNIARV